MMDRDSAAARPCQKWSENISNIWTAKKADTRQAEHKLS